MTNDTMTGFHEYGEYSIRVKYTKDSGSIEVEVLDAIDDVIETIQITNA